DRVKLEWISATEGDKFAQTVKEFTTEIKELGPGPYSDVKQKE
ncbi:hydrogenase iron-sulfur subunit, partial [Candidatus Bipolaricaulota bacterium]|nr:hydrogenase iron-sulfur subunit [Candidatus Bipolaricaulota bacterium]